MLLFIDLSNPGLIALDHPPQMFPIRLGLVHLRKPSRGNQLLERWVHKNTLRLAADSVKHSFVVVPRILYYLPQLVFDKCAGLSGVVLVLSTL